MRIEVAFLPCHIKQLMNLLASSEPYRGSGLRVITLAVRFRAIASFSYSVVLGAGVPPALLN
jgi:hypothetical protein